MFLKFRNMKKQIIIPLNRTVVDNPDFPKQNAAVNLMVVYRAALAEKKTRRKRGCAGTRGEGGQIGQLQRGRVEGGREGTGLKLIGGIGSEMTVWACFGELRQISSSS